MSENSRILHNRSFLYGEKLWTKLFKKIWACGASQQQKGPQNTSILCLDTRTHTPVSIQQQLAKAGFLLSPLDTPQDSRIAAVWVLVNQIQPEGQLPPASDFTSMGAAFLPSTQLFCRTDAAQTLKLFSTKQKLPAVSTFSFPQPKTTGKAQMGSPLATKPRH